MTCIHMYVIMCTDACVCIGNVYISYVKAMLMFMWV